MLVSGQPTEMRLLRNADIHGDKIACSYASDLWVMDRKDGIARRLTSHPGGENYPRFSPDGTQVAFTGGYDGNADVFVVDADGGEPKRLTFTGAPELVLDWTPDGKIAYRSPYGSKTNRMARLWIVDPKGGAPMRTKVEEVSDLSFNADGTIFAYNRANSHQFNWRRYRGGTQGRIGFYNLAKDTYEEVPSKLENRWQPMWVGSSVYYIGDKDFGTRNIFKWDVNAKKETRLTDFKDADIKNPSTDGKTIIWERNGFLETMDIATGKVERVKTFIGSDFLSARPRLLNLSNQIAGMGLSPSGVRLAVEARGEIFSVPAKTGDTRNISQSQGACERQPEWSPDGKLISYIGDASGEKQLYTRPQMGGEATLHKVDKLIANYDWSPDGKLIGYTTQDFKLMTYNPATGKNTLVAQNDIQGGFSYDWAPDGSWIVYTKVLPNLQSAIMLYNVAEGKSTQVSEGYYGDNAVSFDQSGKYIYFTSLRTFAPTGGAFEFMMNMADGERVYAIALNKDVTNPMMSPSDEEPSGEAAPTAAPAGGGEAPKGLKIDLDGIADRIVPLPLGPGSYPFIVGVNNGVVTYADGVMVLWSWAARQPLPIYQGGIAGLAFNAKRNKMAINTGQGISILGVAPGQDPASGRVNTSQVEMMWDPQAEWKQMFGEVWRWERDVFYDPKMGGQDWNAIGKQYEAMVPYVRHRSDLNYIFSQMIAELGTGHAYVQGGDMGPSGTPVPVGHLGADYEVVGNNIRFAKVYKGLNFEEGRRGPLGDLGLNVKDGDYLLEIDGVKVDRNTDPHQLLQGKVGRTVVLTVNSTSAMSGSRKIRVRPIADETELRYISWVEGNRAYVNKMSGGRIGYMHVPDTSMPGVIEFIKGFYSQIDKEAWVIDERYNGGGMIPTFFVEFLRRQVEAGFKARDTKPIFFPTGQLTGPKTMLINEYAGSGGDMLPWLFRESKLGPLIGMRTWGGLVGIQGGVPLVDGGNVTSPGFGIYDPFKGTWIAENTGISPDIEVDARPDLVAQGKDPQLDRALSYLADELKKAKRPLKVPPFPVAKPGI